jgi:hypothetical protein
MKTDDEIIISFNDSIIIIIVSNNSLKQSLSSKKAVKSFALSVPMWYYPTDFNAGFLTDRVFQEEGLNIHNMHNTSTERKHFSTSIAAVRSRGESLVCFIFGLSYVYINIHKQNLLFWFAVNSGYLRALQRSHYVILNMKIVSRVVTGTK